MAHRIGIGIGIGPKSAGALVQRRFNRRHF
jgi:hypothetical protein